MARKDLLDLASLSREEIDLLLDQAVPFKDLFTRSVKKVPALKGKSVLMLFYEPSTRTHSSFEVAAKRLSADVTNFDVPHSSVVKGESVRETVETLQAMRTDYIVVRHGMSGLPLSIARQTRASVINAGDGAHAHPTQGLLDAFTFKEVFPETDGRRVLIVGDILHSRVARSNIWGLRKMGAHVVLVGPPTLVPDAFEDMGVEIRRDLRSGLKDCDVIYLLRIQLERQGGGFFPTLRAYSRFFGLNLEALKKAKPDVLIMHPGPMNRGVEISPEVADGPYSVILDQVTNGVAVRMALLYLLVGGVE